MLDFARQCGRRPKGDAFDLPAPFPEEEEEIEEEEEELDEEVDFDRPTFRRDQIWSDFRARCKSGARLGPIFAPGPDRVARFTPIAAIEANGA